MKRLSRVVLAILVTLPCPDIASATQADQRNGPSSSAGADRSWDTPPRLLNEPLANPRQLLRFFDIGASDLDSFVDGQGISASDEEAFLKILFRLPQIGADEIARWQQTPTQWATLKSDPASQRGEFFLLDGRVRSVLRKTVPAQSAALFDFDHYFEAEVDVEPSIRVTIYARAIPIAWLERSQVDQRCRVSGLFLKIASAGDQRPQFLFAAQRIAWLPDQVDAELGIGSDQVLLGDLGMDIGLYDAVRSRNGLAISAAERECFYALLHAAGQASEAQMNDHATDMQLRRLLQEPGTLHGNVLRVRGAVQRITRVAVNERDVRQLYGIDHYYQLDVLVGLDGAEVQMKGIEDGSKGPTYRSNFPFTCCTLFIPEQWEQFVGQERANIAASLDGFFFKMWAYSNPYVTTFNQKQRQLSPMLILRQPTPAPQPETEQGVFSFLLAAGFLVMLAGIWAVVWLLNRSDRQHSSPHLQQRFKPPGKPDFTDLKQLDE